ncbi:MAG: cbb3-type cytochrome c oxidase subunit II [Acidobacteriota bacterium]|nr:cbb3-type cytochrome c oxidase subunit II [Acidobacteriota bacterium]
MSAGRAVRKAYLVASVAGVLFFVMSVALLGIWPRRVIEAQTAAMSPAHPLGPSESAQRGRAIYAREGCAYCHTQQIRYLHTDMARFGAPTLAWETQFDYPHLWGTRRIGPDLSRTAGTRSADWHFAHLFAPRSIVAQSVMPAYPALFDGAADRPRQEARDLLAYLESLGLARELAGPEGEAHARAACNCAADEMLQMAFEGPINAHPAKTRRHGDVPALAPSTDLARGQQLYGDHCASCHGATGAGDGPGAAALRPRPANLVEHQYGNHRVAEALWHGVAGTAMPAWRDHPLDDLAALAATVRALTTAREEPTLPAHLAAIGARVYAANCAQCHGADGDGRGTAADALPMAPTNFRGQRPTLNHSLQALRRGVEGTPMAPWSGRLGTDEMLAVAHHVRGFFDGSAR